MKKFLLLFSVVFLVSSCQRPWRHPEGYGQDALERDSFKCRVIAREKAVKAYTEKERYEAFGRSEVREVRKQRIDERAFDEAFSQCMEGLGWRR